MIATTSHSFLDSIKNTVKSKSVWPFPFMRGCCSVEYMALQSGKYQTQCPLLHVYNQSIDQADLLIFSGALTYKLVPVLLQMYNKMASPKWVLSVGSCAGSGGLFNSYSVVSGINQKIPVDLHIPGCPPTPLDILQGIEALQEKIAQGDIGK
ncbi:MAG: NADH-quinone oxidoreductase subunit NuoB [Bacteriovoracaceae bacterium]|nr:NADH-quinone oxidoreductase subunit NuoB [Bacteriovoracaceae bacterium]